VAAVNTGNNLVYLIVSMLLGGMAASGLFGKRNLSSIDVDLQFPQEVYANRAFAVKVCLKNGRSRLPVFLMRVKVGAEDVLFPLVDPKAESSAFLPFSFGRRGTHTVDAIYLESRFPFNFFIRSRKVRRAFEVLVFPEPLKCDMTYLRDEERGVRDESAAKGRGDGPDLVTIREYRPGDPLKHVNWKASAKTNSLKTTQFSALSEQPVVIDFDKVTIRHLEEKISCITFMVLHLLKKNTPVGLRLGQRSFRPGLSDAHKFGIMKELALYGQTR